MGLLYYLERPDPQWFENFINEHIANPSNESDEIFNHKEDTEFDGPRKKQRVPTQPPSTKRAKTERRTSKDEGRKGAEENMELSARDFVALVCS
jgi:hypothetical protein